MNRGAKAGRREGKPPLRPARLSGAARVAIFSAGLGAAGIGLFLVFVLNLSGPAGDFRTPWWVLTAMFAIAEILVVHVEFRGNAYSFSLSEIPFVIGLFTANPAEVVLAQVVGSTLALVFHRRSSPLKLGFNVSHFALEACLGLLVFHAFGALNPLEPWSWVAALTATFAPALVADMAVETAVSLAEGAMDLRSMLQRMAFGKLISATNSSVGLIGALVLWVEPAAAWALAVPAGVLFFAYRVYTSQRDHHERIQFLFESTHMLNRALKLEAAIPPLLSQARKMFRAELARVVLFPEGEGRPALRSTLGPGDEMKTLVPVELDPKEGVWARVAAEGEPLLLPRPITNPRLREYFQEEGMRDAMVVPLRAKATVVGMMVVGNRLGDVATFDDEDLRLCEALANHASTALENARLVERLEDSLLHLQEMNRMKDDFVATVSHELRTPLTSIQGSVKTLLQTDLEFGAEDRQTLLEVVDRQGERLRQLIEDLLVAARIEAQPIRAVIAPASLSAVVHQVIEGLGSRPASHRIVFDMAGDPGKVETDERRVYQILSNLVDNALKYSPADTTITLRVRGAAGGVEVVVEDEGPGIPHEQQDRIFDRFYQVDQTSTRAVGGTGLGLYICRRLAEVVGARIALERSDEHGSVFTLLIPVTPPADAVRAEDVPIEETLDLIASQRRLG